MKNLTVGQVVAKDIKFAEVFNKYNIDFCCKGYKSLEQAAKEKEVNYTNLLAELLELELSSVSESEWNNKTLTELIDEIVSKYHQYIRDVSPEILVFLNKIADKHGDNHPELLEILREFQECDSELEMHMGKEEGILFPYIEELEKCMKNQSMYVRPFFDTVINPIERMMEEHSTEGDRFDRIRELTNNYTPPEDACNSYKYAFHKLEEFTTKLHEHIHLENNILFPKAQDLEKSVVSK